VTARASAEDAILVLQTYEVYVVDIQEVGSAAVRINILLSQFKSNTGRVGVASFDIVNGQCNARRATVFVRDGFT
jgi:hypothetical protein